MSDDAQVEPTPHVDRPEGYDDALDQQMRERTAGYDQEVVTRARELGINPDNFETQEELETAIETIEQLRQNEEAE